MSWVIILWPRRAPVTPGTAVGLDDTDLANLCTAHSNIRRKPGLDLSPWLSPRQRTAQWPSHCHASMSARAHGVTWLGGSSSIVFWASEIWKPYFSTSSSTPPPLCHLVTFQQWGLECLLSLVNNDNNNKTGTCPPVYPPLLKQYCVRITNLGLPVILTKPMAPCGLGNAWRDAWFLCFCHSLSSQGD